MMAFLTHRRQPRPGRRWRPGLRHGGGAMALDGLPQARSLDHHREPQGRRARLRREGERDAKYREALMLDDDSPPEAVGAVDG